MEEQLTKPADFMYSLAWETAKSQYVGLVAKNERRLSGFEKKYGRESKIWQEGAENLVIMKKFFNDVTRRDMQLVHLYIMCNSVMLSYKMMWTEAKETLQGFEKFIMTHDNDAVMARIEEIREKLKQL